MKHILSVLVENKPGVLTRVAGLFARRGFNIDSLVVGESEDPRLSRMTITIDGAEQPLDQVTKQLHKLINVVKIRDLDPESMVARELALIRVAAEGDKRTEVLQLAEIFSAKVVDVDRKTIVLEVTAAPDMLAALENLLKPVGVIEIVRTGTVAIGRGRAKRRAPAPHGLTRFPAYRRGRPSARPVARPRATARRSPCPSPPPYRLKRR